MKIVPDYCRCISCPVQSSYDSNLVNGGTREESEVLRKIRCTSCDVWKVYVWQEGKDEEKVEKLVRPL